MQIKHRCSWLGQISRNLSMWEGRLTDGSYIYLRYRWGRLSWFIGEHAQLWRNSAGAFDKLLSSSTLTEFPRNRIAYDRMAERLKHFDVELPPEHEVLKPYNYWPD